jgi:hypothetical protein
MSTVAVSGTMFPSSRHRTNGIPPLPSPGILVFSLSLQLQYVNRRALDLIRRLGHSVPRIASIIRSTHVLELRDQIRAALDDRLDEKIYEPFEVSRSYPTSEERVLLRGIGCPNHSSAQNPALLSSSKRSVRWTTMSGAMLSARRLRGSQPVHNSARKYRGGMRAPSGRVE